MIPSNPEVIDKPKEFIINLARNSNKRAIREDIPPEIGSKAHIGKNYNGRIKEFIIEEWDIEKAGQSSACRSLDKTVNAIISLNLYHPGE